MLVLGGMIIRLGTKRVDTGQVIKLNEWENAVISRMYRECVI